MYLDIKILELGTLQITENDSTYSKLTAHAVFPFDFCPP